MELDALIKAVTEEVMRRLQLPEKKMIIMGQDSEHTLRQCYLKEYQVSLYDRSNALVTFYYWKNWISLN